MVEDDDLSQERDMERRWTTRAEVHLPVDLACAGAHSPGCRTRDIGLGGVFVELPADISLPADEQVELTFRLGNGENITRHRIRARVVRVTTQGVGMVFRDFDATTFRSLQEVLRYKGQSAAPE